MSELAAFQVRLGYLFRNEQLLCLALTHPSLAHDQNKPLPHNQRLEFLGDAVLSIILSRWLYEALPGADEGVLSKSRARLVNAEALATRARHLQFGGHLILSIGADHGGGRESVSALADAFEAVLGALFLDGGLPAAETFVRRVFAPDFAALPQILIGIENPKGELQERLQSRSTIAPTYQLISTSGPDHAREFECAVLHDGIELGRGRGRSKKAAEAEAALAALKNVPPETGPALS